MPKVNATKASLPAGGGGYELENLTIGVFLNDQPTHRLAVGTDKVTGKPLTANQGWILPAGASGICEYDAPLDVMMVEVSREVLSEVGLNDPQKITPVIGDMDPLTLQMALSAEQFGAGDTLYRETMTRALAAQLSNVLQEITDHVAQIEDIRLRRVVDYIHENLGEDLTLETMADLAAMSSYHFSRAFKAATGKSPLQYVIAERIALAQVLLKTTSLTVSEICYRTGYNDQSRFGQHFKRVTGTTPAKFRAE